MESQCHDRAVIVGKIPVGHCRVGVVQVEGVVTTVVGVVQVEGVVTTEVGVVQVVGVVTTEVGVACTW